MADSPPAPSAPSPSDARLDPIPALDGLRGVAVLGVFLFHAGYLDGGFLGVDLFFVLSGFLITALLLVEHRSTGGVRLGRFWARRARRLVPALASLLLGVAVYARLFAEPEQLAEIRQDAIATMAYVANWEAISGADDYWAAFGPPSPLTHTWSLAIEEQFYVVWPLLVLGVLRITRGAWRRLLLVFGCMAAASIVALQVTYHPGASPLRAYFGTDTRAAALLYGAIAAVLFIHRGHHRAAPSARASRTLGAAVGVAALATAVIWATARGQSAWLYEWGFPAVGVAVAIVIYGVATGAGRPLARVLSWPALRHLGVVSYGFYLWHWPLILVLSANRTGLDGAPLAALRFAATLAVSEASFRLVERPIRHGAVTGWRVRALVPAAAGLTAVAIVLATAGAVSRPGPGTTLASGPIGAPAASAGAESTRVLVVGDSGAAFLGQGMAEVAAESGAVVDNQGTIGCGLPRVGDGVRTDDGATIADPPECHAWPERWAELVAATDPDAALLALGWPGIGDREVEGEWVHPCDAGFDGYYRDQVVLAIDVLAATGARVAIALPAPPTFAGIGVERTSCLNRVYREAAAARPGTTLIDLDDPRLRNPTLRPDGVHFEGDGALEAGRIVLSSLTASADAPPPVVLVLGDSTAFRLVTRSDASTALPFVLTESTGIGCGLAETGYLVGDEAVEGEQCVGLTDSWRQRVAETRPDLVVVAAGAWEVLDHWVDGAAVRFDTPEWEATVRAEVEAVVDLAAGRPVALLTAPCYRQVEDALFPLGDRNDPARVAAYNRILGAVAADRPTTSVVDLGGYLCPGGVPVDEAEGEPVWEDGVHLAPAGARLAWSWLSPRLMDLLAAERGRTGS